MTTYARIQDGMVVEIIQPLLDDEGHEWPIDQRFTPAVVATLVDITGLDPQPEEWWTYDGTNFAPPVADAQQ